MENQDSQCKPLLTAICLDNKGVENSFELGVEYIVRGVSEIRKNLWLVENIEGNPEEVLKDRFELVFLPQGWTYDKDTMEVLTTDEMMIKNLHKIHLDSVERLAKVQGNDTIQVLVQKARQGGQGNWKLVPEEGSSYASISSSTSSSVTYAGGGGYGIGASGAGGNSGVVYASGAGVGGSGGGGGGSGAYCLTKQELDEMMKPANNAFKEFYEQQLREVAKSLAIPKELFKI